MAGGWAMGGVGGQQQPAAAADDDNYCQHCFLEQGVFRLTGCNRPVCNFCLRDFVREKHGTGEAPCDVGLAAGAIVLLGHPRHLPLGDVAPGVYVHLPAYPPWYFAKAVKKNDSSTSSMELSFYHNLQELQQGTEPRFLYPGGLLSGPLRGDVYPPTMRPFSEL